MAEAQPADAVARRNAEKMAMCGTKWGGRIEISVWVTATARVHVGGLCDPQEFERDAGFYCSEEDTVADLYEGIVLEHTRLLDALDLAAEEERKGVDQASREIRPAVAAVLRDAFEQAPEADAYLFCI